MDSRPGDETLLLAVAERDMGAFRTLYDRHADGRGHQRRGGGRSLPRWMSSVP
jgi:hypothetical protein